jgi:MoaA/NifB/PqqE/SkfB family radical SAM enzyme
MEVSVVSNGLLIPSFNGEQFDLLKKTASIDISLESHVPNVHNRLRGGDDFFEKTVQGIRLLRQQGILVNINTVISTANYRELADFIEWVRELDADMVNFQPIHIWSNYYDGRPLSKPEYALDLASLADFDKSIDQALAKEKSTGQKTNLKRIRPWIKSYFLAQIKNDRRIWMKDIVPDFKCVEIFTKLFLHSDGSVLPCAMLSPLENIGNKTLAEAVTSLDKTKDMIRRGLFPEECYKCSCQMMLNYNFSIMSNPLANFKNALTLALEYLR